MDLYFLDIFKKLSTSNSIALVSRTNEQITWQQYYTKCLMFADFLKESGVQKSESVAIMGFNSPEWFYAAIGSLIFSQTLGTPKNIVGLTSANVFTRLPCRASCCAK